LIVYDDANHNANHVLGRKDREALGSLGAAILFVPAGAGDSDKVGQIGMILVVLGPVFFRHIHYQAEVLHILVGVDLHFCKFKTGHQETQFVNVKGTLVGHYITGTLYKAIYSQFIPAELGLYCAARLDKAFIEFAQIVAAGKHLALAKALCIVAS
jgi:hypothetical protein